MIPTKNMPKRFTRKLQRSHQLLHGSRVEKDLPDRGRIVGQRKFGHLESSMLARIANYFDEVRELLAPAYPEIATATFTGPKDTGTASRYTFARAIGSKG